MKEVCPGAGLFLQQEGIFALREAGPECLHSPWAVVFSGASDCAPWPCGGGRAGSAPQLKLCPWGPRPDFRCGPQIAPLFSWASGQPWLYIARLLCGPISLSLALKNMASK